MLDTALSWTKTHQLEGDGLLPLLYHHLWKKNKCFQSCPGVKLPDTVVYEHNFPRAWYTYDFKNSEIAKRAGRYLDTQHIYQAFSKTTSATDICAQYLFTSETDAGAATSVAFMTPKELEHFLIHRKHRPDGILQRFLPTTDCNTQIQVIWSPRVTLVQRRVNKSKIGDRTMSAYRRAVTYDGPTHFSVDGLCSNRTKNQIIDLCLSIVRHFNSTEHKTISRFVLYFKASPVPRHAAADGHDNLWLLWASSLRIGQNAHTLRPLNLAPNFGEASADSGDNNADNDAAMCKALYRVDRRQLGLSHDGFLFRLCREERERRKATKLRGGGTRRRGKGHARAYTPAPPPPSLTPPPEGPARPQTARLWRERRDDSSLSMSPAPSDDFVIPCPPCTARAKSVTSNRGGPSEGNSDALNDTSNLGSSLVQGEYGNDDQSVLGNSAGVRESTDALRMLDKLARQFIDDSVYELYSHMLRKRDAVFSIKVPPEVEAFLNTPPGEQSQLLALGSALLDKDARSATRTKEEEDELQKLLQTQVSGVQADGVQELLGGVLGMTRLLDEDELDVGQLAEENEGVCLTDPRAWCIRRREAKPFVMQAKEAHDLVDRVFCSKAAALAPPSAARDEPRPPPVKQPEPCMLAPRVVSVAGMNTSAKSSLCSTTGGLLATRSKRSRGMLRTSSRNSARHT